jgi:hypothetical protein
MEANNLGAGPHGFRHIRRGLEAGESLPRCPLLVEQLLAISAHSHDPLPADEADEERVAVAAGMDDDEDDDL